VPSIIVPARNAGELTVLCLNSLLHAVSRLKLSCEFILVDDASAPEDGIQDIFRKFRAQAMGHECKIVRAKRHLHYTGVFSSGLHLATRDLIFFISNDMVVPASFLEALLGVSALSREFGIVRGTSNHTDSHPEHIVMPKVPLKTMADADVFSRAVFEAQGLSYVEDRVLSGDAVLIKRALIEKIGVLDTRFFGYFGDIDFGMRAHLAGFKLVCAKGAWLHHHGAGHVMAEFHKKAASIPYEELHRQRMALVGAAYQEFRKKWDIASPADYADVRAPYFFETARANREKVPLKYELPAVVLQDLEFH
jgi:GT2 family glycosyltransferase